MQTGVKMEEVAAQQRAKVVSVVSAVIVREGRVLVARRRKDQVLPNRLHLPGGKVEEGESPLVAITREIEEELGITRQQTILTGGDVQPIAQIQVAYAHGKFLVRFYRAYIGGWEPRNTGANANLYWHGLAELEAYAADWLQPDLLVARLRLLEEGEQL